MGGNNNHFVEHRSVIQARDKSNGLSLLCNTASLGDTQVAGGDSDTRLRSHRRVIRALAIVGFWGWNEPEPGAARSVH